MGLFEGPVAVDGFNAAAWWANDGAVSQKEPWLGRPEPADAVEFRGDWPDDPVPGRWHVGHVGGRDDDGLPRESWDHLDIAPFPGTREIRKKQVRFYESLLRGLRTL